MGVAGLEKSALAAAFSGMALAFCLCALLQEPSSRAFGQTITPQRGFLLQSKARLLKSIATYDREEQNSRSLLEQAEEGKRQALAAGQTSNAEMAEQASENARQAIANAQRFRAEDQARLEAINRALTWPESAKPFAVSLILRGQVQKKTANGWASFDPNSPLRPGDEISVGPDSYLELQFQDGTGINLGSRSTFLYEETEHHPIYELIFGRLRSFHPTAPDAVLGSKEKPRYKTLTAIVAVRGTEFVLETEKDTALLTVFEGSVEVELGTGGKKIAVEKGQQLNLPKAGPAQQPVSFDPAKVKRWWE
jgi:ferric-dicitrate binding protein FerR (iron transport regulator)